MKLPLSGSRSIVGFTLVAALVTVGCIAINVLLLPGWMYTGTIELVVLLGIYGLFSSQFSGMTLRFGILVYAVTTGLIVVARTHPSMMGDFTYGNALGPFAGNAGLLLALPWFLIVMLSLPVAMKLHQNIYVRSLLGAALVLVPALFLCYNCASLDFIYWTEIYPPMRAFIIIFLAGFFLHFTASQMQVKSENVMAVPLYVTWLSFNILLLLARVLLKN